VFFTRRGEGTYLLLVGGDKSTQKRDIRHQTRPRDGARAGPGVTHGDIRSVRRG
jgi:hypothetical protein